MVQKKRNGGNRGKGFFFKTSHTYIDACIYYILVKKGYGRKKERGKWVKAQKKESRWKNKR